MKQKLTPLRRSAVLLLAAAALPLTALSAQETQTATPPYAGDGITPPADVGPSPVEPVLPQPTATTPAPIATTPIPVVPAPTVEEPAPARTTARTPPRRTAAPARPTAVGGSAPIVADTAPAPAAAPAASIAPAPAAEAAPPATPAAEAVPVDAAVPVTTDERGGAIWPWLLGGALLVAALFLFARRRRRSPAQVHEETYESRVAPAVERESVIAAAPSDGPDPMVAAVAAEEPAGRPWIGLQMRPIRAGVSGDDAVVEFELMVDNEGTAPARDVRISTFMLAAGSAQESEMERMLIEPPAGASLPDVDVEAGQVKRVEAAVALPTAGLADSVLPVVVAEARYTLPDGSEGRTSASFAVGVPVDDELAHFDLEHPSGLHDDVEARLRREPERV